MLAYSDPGDLILDPNCATGSVLVEAIRHGRRAIGLTTNPNQGALAIANISNARGQGAPGRAAILKGSAEQLPGLLRQARSLLDANTTTRTARHPAGSVRLILTAPDTAELTELLPQLPTVLAPGGFLLLTLNRHNGPPVGLGAIIDTAEDAGLHYWQHVIALRVARHAHAAPVVLHTDVLAFRKPVPAHAVRTAARAVSA